MRSFSAVLAWSGLVLGCAASPPPADLDDIQFAANAQPSEEYLRQEMARELSREPLELPEDARYPIPLGSRLIDPATGRMVAAPADLPGFVFSEPVPGTTGLYTMTFVERHRRPGAEDFVSRLAPAPGAFDARAMKFTRPPAPELSDSNGEIVRTDKAGRPVWSRKNEWGAHLVNVFVADDTYVLWCYAKGRGLVALSRATGDVKWHLPGLFHRTWTTGHDVVFAEKVAGYEDSDPRWVAALGVDDGRERFTIPVPGPIAGMTLLGSLLLITGDAPEFGKNAPWTLICEPNGTVLRNLPGELSDAMHFADRYVLCVGGSVFCTGNAVDEIWKVPELFYNRVKLHREPRGNILVLAFNEDADGHETLALLSPTNGLILWRAQPGTCFGHGHSSYRHQAHIEFRGSYIFVVTHAFYGNTITVVDAATGERVRRWCYDYR